MREWEFKLVFFGCIVFFLPYVLFQLHFNVISWLCVFIVFSTRGGGRRCTSKPLKTFYVTKRFLYVILNPEGKTLFVGKQDTTFNMSTNV